MTNSFWKCAVLGLGLSIATFSFAAELSRPLPPQVSVAGQMNSTKFQELMKQGFKSVIVNRPDQETGNEVSVGQLRTIAEKYHTSVIYQPVISGQITQQNIEEFSKYYNELPKPILMVCRSGTRSAALYHKAKEQGLIHE
ncbi:beta-lactamase hydrolase domain-containing protein [Acinetobacter schindleri]|uniref:beta-lactamase hydrolase domain-containing protein n=1 Tax=Acinetobacter schindleri TaxID=108981 RepID=UPI00289E109B|nr:sulfur transferase domain-containing protein [Acinetobacter schindleri]